VGKTTLSGLLARLYAAEGRKVLAVDADPDANLASALGISPEAAKKAVPLAEQADMIEERTGARRAHRPRCSASIQGRRYPETYSVQHEGVRLLVVGKSRRRVRVLLSGETRCSGGLSAISSSAATKW